MIRKKTYAEIKDYIEGINGNGCKLLTKNEPKNVGEKLLVQCHCGNNFEITFENFSSKKSKKQCPKCSFAAMGNRYKMNGQDVIDLFVSNDLSAQFEVHDYRNAKQQLPYICNKHIDEGIQYITYDHLHGGEGCKYCGNAKIADRQRLDGRDVYNAFFDRGYTPLFDPEDYNNAFQKLHYICDKHPCEIQSIIYNSFNRGSGCALCGAKQRADSKRLDGEYVITVYKEFGFTPLFAPGEYVTSNQLLPCICDRHKHLGMILKSYSSIVAGKGCNQCKIEKIIKANYKGLTPLSGYLRGKISYWKLQTMKSCNYKCVLTGEAFDDIHHLTSFSLILDNVMEYTNFPIYELIGDYTDIQIEILIEEVNKRHTKLGVCLKHSAHDLFHNLYGRGHNTPEQFEEFRDRWNKGEFNELGVAGE